MNFTEGQEPRRASSRKRNEATPAGFPGAEFPSPVIPTPLRSYHGVGGDGRGSWEAHFFRPLCQTGAHLKEKNRGSRREVAL